MTRLQILTHPLDRSIAMAFSVTIFFTLLALVTGVPIVFILILLLPLGIACKYICSCFYCYSLCEGRTGVGRATSSWTSRIQGSVNFLSPPSSPPPVPGVTTTASSPMTSSHPRQQHPHHHHHHRSRNSRRYRKLIPLTPLEQFHVSHEWRNNHRFGISNSLLFVDKSLSLEQLKDMVCQRILRKAEFARFTSHLVFRGEYNRTVLLLP